MHMPKKVAHPKRENEGLCNMFWIPFLFYPVSQRCAYVKPEVEETCTWLRLSGFTGGCAFWGCELVMITFL
jgi:hypothetical protein